MRMRRESVFHILNLLNIIIITAHSANKTKNTFSRNTKEAPLSLLILKYAKGRFVKAEESRRDGIIMLLMQSDGYVRRDEQSLDLG